MSELLECKICNNYRAKQLHQHLKAAHGMSSFEYRSLFGNDSILQIGFSPFKKSTNESHSDYVKNGYQQIKKKLENIDTILSKEETRTILLHNDLYLRYIGRTKQRTLIKEHPMLYKSIYEHTKILNDIPKFQFNKLPNRIKFIIDFNYNQDKLKCQHCFKVFTFSEYCRRCHNTKNPQTGKKHSPEAIQKMRLSIIKYLKSLSGERLTPRYNKNSISIIEQYGKENGYNFQHAENGGEFHLKELGYWADGYDKEKNVWIEYDEKHHFDIFGNLKEKDIRREQEIRDFLKCEFIRIGYNVKK